MKKFKVQKVEVIRAEGLTNLCGHKKEFGSVSEANSWLLSQTNTLPKDGGYDKHDFTITFEDGETYDGCLDCKHHSCEHSDLDVRKHVVDHLQIYGNLLKPVWMDDETCSRFQDDNKKQGYEKDCREFLKQYEI